MGKLLWTPCMVSAYVIYFLEIFLVFRNGLHTMILCEVHNDNKTNCKTIYIMLCNISLSFCTSWVTISMNHYVTTFYKIATANIMSEEANAFGTRLIFFSLYRKLDLLGGWLPIRHCTLAIHYLVHKWLHHWCIMVLIKTPHAHLGFNSVILFPGLRWISQWSKQHFLLQMLEFCIKSENEKQTNNEKYTNIHFM